MKLSFFRRIAAHLLAWSCVAMFVLGLNSCGGGGGGGDDDEVGPAPFTMNGLVMTLYTGGVELTFIRSDGDAATGTETGAFTMKERPGATPIVDSSGNTTPLQPSTRVSGGRYTYIRNTEESGTITVTGFSSGVFNTDAFFDGIFIFLPAVNVANYFKGPTVPFTRTYSVLFGTNGASITGIDVNDTGEDLTVFWNDAILRVFGGALVTNGWSLENSSTVNLPKLYPTALSGEELVITPTNPTENGFNYSFLTSTFTRFSDTKGDFIEEGVGNSVVIGQTERTIINYNYQPEPASTNKAVIRIFNPTGPPFVYTMTFLDLEKGTYVREDGSVGNFEFPFLN
jgi:hypothetical protein